MSEESIEFVYQGVSRSFRIDTSSTSVKDLVELVARELGLVNVKLVLKGGKLLDTASTLRCSEAGIGGGCKVMILGSKAADVERVLNSRDLPGMAGFDEELKRIASRRKRSDNSPVKLPSGPYTFASYEAWQLAGLSPPPSEAIKLLHKLAADPGIVDIMQKRSWRVGKLSEMPPEGKEGISPMCILGVNINAGQEISLRLRTDDLKGFRRYLSIRDTLCHELAHMVFSEHDNRFKTLNSEIRRHVESMSRSAGTKLFEAAQGWDLDVPSSLQDAMSATAASSGSTLRQLAAASAVQVEALGHRDRQTEAKEAAAERLSSLQPASAQQSQPVPEAETSMDLEPSLHAGESAAMGCVNDTQQRLQQGSGAVRDLPQPEDQGLREILSNTSNNSEGDEELSRSSRLEASEAATTEQVDRAQAQGELQDRASSAHAPAEEAPASQGQDPSANYLTNAKNAVDLILRSAELQSAVLGLKTLLTILKNALENPADPKFRRIKLQNPAFQQRAGRLPGSLALLESAGFVLRGGEGGEQVLRLEREDPGLLWLTLSACEQGLQQVGGS